MQISPTTQKLHLKQVRKLEKAGIPEDQAKAVVELIGERVHVSVSSAMSEVVEKYRLNEMATRDDLEKMVEKYRLNEVATKSDLENMVLKYHLDEVATKSDLESMVEKYHLAEVATKSDLEEMATKYRLDEMATKADLEKMESKFNNNLENMELRLNAKIAPLRAMLYYQFAIMGVMVSVLTVFIVKFLQL